MKHRIFLLIFFYSLVGSTSLPIGRADVVSSSTPSFEQAMADFDRAQQILSKDVDKARKLFRSAATRLAAIAAGGVENGYLEYDMGNCYLQAGDIGRAILHFKRAKRLIPNDDLLSSNLSLARSRCVTQIRRMTRSEVLKTIFFLHYQLALRQRVMFGLTAFIAIWFFLLARNFARRKWTVIGASASALIAAGFAVSVAASLWADRNEPQGVVLESDVTVYKGPATSYQRLFEQPLQPGVEFTLRERRGDWWRVELADGNAGWIPRRVAELVPRQPNETVAFLGGR